jgi:hypothetical protein
MSISGDTVSDYDQVCLLYRSSLSYLLIETIYYHYVSDYDQVCLLYRSSLSYLLIETIYYYYTYIHIRIQYHLLLLSSLH